MDTFRMHDVAGPCRMHRATGHSCASRNSDDEHVSLRSDLLHEPEVLFEAIEKVRYVRTRKCIHHDEPNLSRSAIASRRSGSYSL
jgi:hypothetical protein